MLYREGVADYIPYEDIDYSWNDPDLPYMKVRAIGKTKKWNILIMHDGDVLKGRHNDEKFKGTEIIICCHPSVVKEITGDERIAYEYGDKPVRVLVGLYNAVTEHDELEITVIDDPISDEDISYFKLIHAGLA